LNIILDSSLANGRICTIEMQSAIDACEKDGGGTLVFPSGIYLIGTIMLKSNVTLNLEKGAVLLGSENIEDYPESPASFVDAVGHTRGRCLILAHKAKKSAIIGEGEIRGNGAAFFEDSPHHLIRPFLVRLVECEDVTVRGVKLTDAAAWCLHLFNCDSADIDGVDIHNRVNNNNDGIDIDSSCNVRIRRCNVSSGDDAICLKTTGLMPCENILVEDCRVSSDCAGFKIGTESVGDFRNIIVRRCYFEDVFCCMLKITPVDGAQVENVTVEDIEFKNCTGPIFVSLGERLRQYAGVGRTDYSSITNLVLRNIHGSAIDFVLTRTFGGKPWGNALGEIVLSGSPCVKLKNILLQDFDIQMPGNVDYIPENEAPEMGTQYPEFHLFGVLPSHGVFLRHIENIRMENVHISLKNPDVRPKTACQDVDGYITS